MTSRRQWHIIVTKQLEDQLRRAKRIYNEQLNKKSNRRAREVDKEEQQSKQQEGIGPEAIEAPKTQKAT
ncbi:hypothetical protein CHS0354_023225 [Potamilus streckersoni]|uniref:Uncharacterized protein n=1 Tax=Potamilus streckersoni TaxID=2493646 RepID=A0AAE0VXW1_9BIVA|nr:hypothetical protein CHS0354_023225 [Potamilus streckersoni]